MLDLICDLFEFHDLLLLLTASEAMFDIEEIACDRSRHGRQTHHLMTSGATISGIIIRRV